MAEKIDHRDAWNVACHRREGSNFARSYIELRVALQRLEECCDRSAAIRPQAAYDAIVAVPDGSDTLLALDFARKAAREILSAVDQ